MDPAERQLTENEKKLAAQKEITEVKSPTLAAGLSLLPGVGTLYLASDKGKSSKVKDHNLGTLAMVNYLTWPASILWAVPQSYIDAQRINIKETLYEEKNDLSKL